MKAIDTFYYSPQNRLTADTTSLMRFYFPLMGEQALALYLYFLAFFDNGLKPHKFSEILNHNQFGMQTFEQALAILTALDLVAFYQQEDSYLIRLKAALDAQHFLANPVYRKSLEGRIGQPAVADMDLPDVSQTKDLSKKFSDVFSQVQAGPQPKVQSKTDFDLTSFKNRMQQDGLAFADETADLLELNRLAEQYGMTWYETYLLAKETANHQQISTKRMQAKKEQGKSRVASSDFSKEEENLIGQAKAAKAEVFLAKIKKTRQAVITADERKLLDDLAAMSFLDEVINVMVLYTIAKTKSANINKRYLMKIANDFSYQKINSAEAAVEKMRSFDQQKSQQKTSKSAPVSNVPDWSNQDYKNETSADEQARLDQIKRERLAKLRKGGD